MIDFDEAISTAFSNVTKLVPGAENIKLEEALISEDGKLFEITYSYEVDYATSKVMSDFKSVKSNHLRGLAAIMGVRRQYKVFLIDSRSGAFRGFRNKG